MLRAASSAPLQRTQSCGMNDASIQYMVLMRSEGRPSSTSQLAKFDQRDVRRLWVGSSIAKDG